MPAEILVIACGAIARELVRIRDINNWDHIEFQCLPAELHNTPKKIPAAVRAKIESEGGRFRKVFVAYADCGTGGLLDKAIAERVVCSTRPWTSTASNAFPERIATSFMPEARLFMNWRRKNREVFI